MANSKVVRTRLSEAQWEAFKAELGNRGWDEATLLREALHTYMREHRIHTVMDWPDDDPKHGGARNSRKVDK
jgi:hypothetical protein